MTSVFSFVKFVVLLFLVQTATAWDQEELEIFDLVEEINLNFYTVLGIQQNATLPEVKRAFRGLSIQLHPDKNDAEDANVQFRNLVSVYDVLKDTGKREKYDKVLREGLPNWKSALYYYRHVRKMGLAEMALILFVIITVCQYLISWAAYAEKKFTTEQLLGSKLKKLQKKNKNSVDIDTILKEIPSPSVFNTLPFQIPRTIWTMPKAIKSAYVAYKDYKEEQAEIKRQEDAEIEHQRLIDEEFIREKEAKKEGIKRRKQIYAAKEKTDEDLKGFSKLQKKTGSNVNAVRPALQTKVMLSGGLWTDEDLTELVRLVKKYPGGTTDRWDIIAEQMNRSVAEITFMSAKMKENGYKLPGQADNNSVAENIVLEVKKIKTKKEVPTVAAVETNWSQDQQQALESAIMKYPKNSSADRWSKISNSVPGKTKEECLLRYKHLVEVIKAQKAKEKLEAEIADNRTDDNKVLDDVQDVENPQVVEEVSSVPHKGKPKNKRKERKKKMDFSSSDSDDIEEDD